jgi:hypothetical protein
MKTGLRWLLLPAAALTLASCAASYGSEYYGNGYGYYGNYRPYAYPTDFYRPFYGGVIIGGGHNDGRRHWNHHGWGHAGAGHWRGGGVHDGSWHGGMHGHGGHGGHSGGHHR